MTAVATFDGLTDQERKFVENYSLGMTQSQAARAAGYAHPHERAKEMLRKQHILTALEVLRAKNEEIAQVKRADVIEGFKEAVDIGRQLQDPVAMIAGWREIGRICGHYEPTKKTVEISINGQVAINRLEQLPDAELAKLIEGEVIDTVEDE